MKINLFKYKRFKGGGCAYKVLGCATLIRTLSIAPSVSNNGPVLSSLCPLNKKSEDAFFTGLACVYCVFSHFKLLLAGNCEYFTLCRG